MKKLKIAIQKNGRLNEKSRDLLRQSGFEFSNGNVSLRDSCTNFPLEILYLRDDDIPGYVSDGVVDIGIVGLNIVSEKSFDVKIIEFPGFAKCRLSIAVPQGFEYAGLKCLEGKTIATSYPVILKNYLENNYVQAKIHEISGSVEIAPVIGLTDAICDIVSTGSTLISNGLKEVETVMESEAVIIANTAVDGEKQKILEKFLLRIKSVKKAKNTKYILLNSPNDCIEKIVKILPGMKSPTILPLAEDGWSSLHSVIAEDTFWEKIEQLKEAGAQGILIVPIEKMIM